MSEHSQLEIDLAVEALCSKWRYIECNPDVGFGPMIEHVFDDLAKAVHAEFSPEEKKKIVSRAKRRTKR